MSRETWEILQQMEPKDVELQLALQCAPLIAGLKPSNLFNIPCEGVCQVRELIRDTGISMYVLFSTGRKAAVLLYRRESLEKYMEQEGFMFIGTQCDLWGRPDGTGHEKISRGKFPRLTFSLIPSLFERHISIGCADLIWDITLDEISALCLFIGRGPFFA